MALQMGLFQQPLRIRKQMSLEKELLDYFGQRSEEPLTFDTDLVENSVIDSMGVMELIEFLEAQYGVQLDMDDLTIENFATVRGIANLIEAKRGQG
jgi:acyl carrier protein